MTDTLDKFTQDTSQVSQSTMMPQRCNLSHSHSLTCFVVDSLVKLSPLLGKDEDLMIVEAHSFLKLLGLLRRKDHVIYSLKTSEAYYLTTKGKRSESYSQPLMKWGMMRNGKLLTANISFHKTGSGSSLSDILEEKVPDKYFLSETAIKSIIEHDKRHKEKGNGFHAHIVQVCKPPQTKAPLHTSVTQSMQTTTKEEAEP